MNVLGFEDLLFVMLRKAYAIEILDGKIRALFKAKDAEDMTTSNVHTHSLIQLFKHHYGHNYQGNVRYTFDDANQLVFELDLGDTCKFESSPYQAMNKIKRIREELSYDSITLIERKLFDFMGLNVKRLKGTDILNGEMIQVETVEWIKAGSVELAIADWLIRVVGASVVLVHPQRTNTIYFEFRCYTPAHAAAVRDQFTPRQPIPITVADA